MKLDIQGAELEVLRGSKKTLTNVLGLEIEVNFKEIYHDIPLAHDVEEFLKKELRLMMEDGIRLRAIGDLSGLPNFARQIVEETIEQTKENSRWNLTLALNYGSRQEVLQAVARYGQDHPTTSHIPTWEEFSPYLQTKDLPDPDLIIRTSGEFRLSNFLLLQAAYAEIFVSSLHWPDFGRDAFLEALSNYAHRERRFGKTSEQLNHPVHTS